MKLLEFLLFDYQVVTNKIYLLFFKCRVRPNKRKQHDNKNTQNKMQNQILNLFKEGDHKGTPLQKFI